MGCERALENVTFRSSHNAAATTAPIFLLYFSGAIGSPVIKHEIYLRR
jgi:predicted phage tail protein